MRVICIANLDKSPLGIFFSVEKQKTFSHIVDKWAKVLEVINFVRMKIELAYSFGILLITIFFHTSELSAQPETSTVNFLIVQNTFSDYREHKPRSPKLVSLPKKSFLSKLNPLNYSMTGLLFFYQYVLSEQIQANCNYEISCSNYTKKCIEKFGKAKGVLLGFDQLTNCSVAEIYDFPPHKISSNSKIINAFDFE